MGRRGGKRKFAGRNMHIEFHNVNPKRGKAADCIYLTEDRVCQNKKSPHYLAKCFAASYCTFKVKEKDAFPPEPAPLSALPTPSPKKEEPNASLVIESFRDKITAGNQEKWTIHFSIDEKPSAHSAIIGALTDAA